MAPLWSVKFLPWCQWNQDFKISVQNLYLAIIVKDQNISKGPKLICIKDNGKTQTDFKETASKNTLKGNTENI